MKLWIPGGTLIALGFVAAVLSFAMSEGLSRATEEAVLNASTNMGRISVILILAGVSACLLALQKEQGGKTDG